MIRTWNKNNLQASTTQLWDYSKIKEHKQVHETMKKKTSGFQTQNLLKAIDMDMIYATSNKQVPQRFWECDEFMNLMIHFEKLVETSDDPIAELKRLVTRRARANKTIEFDMKIQSVSYYNFNYIFNVLI